MRRKLLIFSLIFAAFFVVSRGLDANDSPDTKGWTNLVWGMSRDEICKLYPSASDQYDDDGLRFFGLADYAINGYRFFVRFHFDKLKKLDFVELYPSLRYRMVDKQPSPRFLKSVICDLDEDVFVNGVTDKYGASSQKTTEAGSFGGSETIWLWVLPSTKIEISRSTHAGSKGDRDSLFLNYSARKDTGQF